MFILPRIRAGFNNSLLIYRLFSYFISKAKILPEQRLPWQMQFSVVAESYSTTQVKR